MRKQKDKLQISILCSKSKTDIYVAEILQKKLNRFSSPKSMGRKVKLKTRFFIMDYYSARTSSDFEEAVTNIIDHTDWLIIVCSPDFLALDLKDIFLKKYIQQKGAWKISICIADGEHGSVIPEALLCESDPLAADFRAKRKRDCKDLIDSDYLKIISQILGVNFDDLKQRRRINSRVRRRNRILAFISVYMMFICILFAYVIATEAKKKVFNEEWFYYTQKLGNNATNLIEKNVEKDRVIDAIYGDLQQAFNIELYDSGGVLLCDDEIYRNMYRLFPYEVVWTDNDTGASDEMLDAPQNKAELLRSEVESEAASIKARAQVWFSAEDEAWKIKEGLYKFEKKGICEFALELYPNGNYRMYINNKDSIVANQYKIADEFSLDQGRSPIDTYLGKDKDGMRYFTGGDMGYIFGPYGSLIATVEYLYNIDLETQELILKKGNAYKRVEIQSKEKCVEKLTEVLRQRGWY